jgi:gliding motility-associated-like protein
MRIKSLLFLFFISISFSYATHYVGGSLSYEHLGGSTYRVTLKMYRDCRAGNAAFPASVVIQVRQPNGAAFAPSRNITINFPGAAQVNPLIDTCAVDPGLCLQEAIYSKVVNNLPPNPGGYHLYWQYCCRNNTLSNIVNPLNAGSSLYSYIPDNSVYFTNSSPKWVNFPPVFVCQGNPLVFDHSATDADGDSLVYSLYTPYNDAPVPTFPGNVATFTPINWIPNYSANFPLDVNGVIPMIVSQQGIITVTPPAIGQFLVGIKVTEYRNGVSLGYTLRDFQFNIVNCPPLAAAGIGPSDVCDGGAMLFNNTTFPAANNYFWNFGDLATLADTSLLQSPSYTYPGPGSYNVTLIINRGTGCADTAYRTVSVSSTIAAFTSNAPQCIGTPINFTDASTVSGNTTITNWDWDFGDGNTSNIQNPSNSYNTSGTYPVRLIITSGLGCKDTVIVNVVIQGLPIANAGNDTLSCVNNATINLGGTILNAGGGIWTGLGSFSPNNTTLNATYTPTVGEVAGGSAMLILTSTNNGLCPGDVDTVIILFSPSPVANGGPDIYVCKDSTGIPLNGTVQIAASGTWSTNGSGTFNPPNPNVLNPTYTPSAADTAAGSVMLILTTTGNGNCFPVSDTVVIFFTATPTANIVAPDTACAGDIIPLVAISSTNSGGWITLGTGTFSGQANNGLNILYTPSAADALNGSVTVVFTSTNNGGCLAVRDTAIISLIPSPIASFTYTVACPGDSTVFTNTTTTPGFIVSQLWNFGDNATSAQSNPLHIYASGRNYTVTLIVVSNNGCIDTVSQIVPVFYFPNAGFTVNGVCLNEGTQFNDTSQITGGNAVSWLWTFGDGTQSIEQNPNHKYSAAGNYNVTLVVTSNQGCKDTITATATVYPNPVADFTVDDPTPIIGQQVQFTDKTPNSIAWNWDFGDGGSSNIQNPSHAYNTGGYFDVLLTATDANGCSDTALHKIIVSIPPKVPSGFSPNGDGQNDILYVLGGPYIELEFKIYNGWGELIFVSTLQKDGWDGTRNAILQPIGVYVYTVKGRTADGEAHELSGDVTLLR